MTFFNDVVRRKFRQAESSNATAQAWFILIKVREIKKRSERERAVSDRISHAGGEV